MSNFFDSKIVKETLEELAEMQSDLVQQVLYVPYMTKEQKVDHLQLMKNFLEKQKLLFFRMSLSSDSEARDVCEQIINNARMFGIVQETNPDEFFKYLEGVLEGLEKILDN